MCPFELWLCLGIRTVVVLLGHMVVLFLVFFKEPPYGFPLWLYQFTFTPTAKGFTFLHTLSSLYN